MNMIFKPTSCGVNRFNGKMGKEPPVAPVTLIPTKHSQAPLFSLFKGRNIHIRCYNCAMGQSLLRRFISNRYNSQQREQLQLSLLCERVITLSSLLLSMHQFVFIVSAL